MTRPTYCLTGTFELGTLRDVSAALNKLQCRVLEDVSSKVDYLLIGALTEGRTAPMDAALNLIFEGRAITLLHEAHWLAGLGNCPEVVEILDKARQLPDGSAFKRAPSKAKTAAWEGQVLIRLRYRNAKGEESDREVRLHKVTTEPNGRPAALIGFCLMRQMNRTFKAANVVSTGIVDSESGDLSELQALLAKL